MKRLLLFYFAYVLPGLAANVACPENIGGQAQSCGSSFCGGEDETSKGQCKTLVNGARCSCNPAESLPPPVPDLATVTASGATGTYMMATMTEYKDLRQAITATITTAPTKTGEPGDEIAVVIFAGDVAWYLAGRQQILTRLR